MLAALSGCSQTGSPSAARTDTTTTWINLAYLGNSVNESMATVTGPNVTYANALNAAFADVAKQERKLTLDDGAIQTDRFGRGCNAADAAAYASCQSSERQLAANAEADAAGAQAQVDADFVQAASAASTYLSVLQAFIGQMVALPWPSALSRYVSTMVAAARSYRKDVSFAAGISPNTPQSSISAFSAKSGVDAGHFNDALSALKAAFRKEAK